ATTVALPSAQKVAAASAGLPIAKLRSAREILLGADVDLDMGATCIINPAGLTDLLSATEITSSDYNTVKALVQGQVDTFL
ncbi:phage capsid protein, partial [Streptococcus pseudopneumoniae]|uniref:phage capsid protein n=1 Tax=Streptococcus pseudopneumoniae TaxID=257758 RepID=UPI0019D4F835